MVQHGRLYRVFDTYRFSIRERSRSEEMCAICCEDYSEEEILVSLPCNKKHVFHKWCIEGWLKRKGNCPLCKENVMNAEAFQVAIGD